MELQHFLQQVAKRLNLDTAIKGLTYAALVCSMITLLGALVYLLKGYAVPGYVFVIALLVGIGVLICLVTRRWVDSKKAAQFADQYFDLKNGIVTTLHLSDSNNARLSALQEEWTAKNISCCNATQIPLNYSKRLAIVAFLMMTGAASTALIPTSQTILKQEAEEEFTLDRSEKAIEALKKVVEEMADDLDDEEAKELDLDVIRKEVNKLEATGDRKEAVRQFARLEQKSREMSKELEQKKDEESLRESIKNLKKASSKEAKEIAKQLEKKEFKKASQNLKKLTPKKPNEKLSKEEQIKIAKEQVERLRSVSKQLAAGANSNSQSERGAGASGEGGLDAAMQELDSKAKALENILKKSELEFQRDPNANLEAFKNELSECEQSTNKVANKWIRMQAKQSAKKRLDGL